DNSLVVGSAQHRRIEDAARAHGIDVLLGFSEYEDGRIYMAQMLIDREGTTVMTRRKLKPSGREGGFYSPGTADRDLVVVDRPYA
ncbi:nitrilase-related carbon-nitrogen hydrolase, partial [Streptomyces galilaeus]|uniref:nitrilase-related carbon-nitrogen hydrolase n=1 Tax=Streptomyces galilaeus TaxID=33899 RepID=UPI0038F6F17D